MTTSDLAVRADKMHDALATESDRGCAAIAVGVFDEALEQIFLRRMRGGRKAVELLDANGPLGIHSTRLKLAYCLGWIGEATYFQADQIRRIRNEMAHKLDVDSFDHPTVQKFIGKLPPAVPD